MVCALNYATCVFLSFTKRYAVRYHIIKDIFYHKHFESRNKYFTIYKQGYSTQRENINAPEVIDLIRRLDAVDSLLEFLYSTSCNIYYV